MVATIAAALSVLMFDGWLSLGVAAVWAGASMTLVVSAPLHARGYVPPGQPRLVVGYDGLRIYLSKPALIRGRPAIDVPWSAVLVVRLTGTPPALMISLNDPARAAMARSDPGAWSSVDLAITADGCLVVPDVITADLPHAMEHYSRGTVHVMAR